MDFGLRYPDFVAPQPSNPLSWLDKLGGAIHGVVDRRRLQGELAPGANGQVDYSAAALGEARRGNLDKAKSLLDLGTAADTRAAMQDYASGTGFGGNYAQTLGVGTAPAAATGTAPVPGAPASAASGGLGVSIPAPAASSPRAAMDIRPEAQQFGQAFSALGYNPAAVAGWLGNIQQENSGTASTKPYVDSDGLIHRGSIQWSPERWARVSGYAAKNGLDINTPAGQAKAADWELKTYYPQVYAQLQRAQTPEEAATILGKGYEVTGFMGPRASYARQAFNKLGAQGPQQPYQVAGPAVAGPGGNAAPAASVAASAGAPALAQPATAPSQAQMPPAVARAYAAMQSPRFALLPPAIQAGAQRLVTMWQQQANQGREQFNADRSYNLAVQTGQRADAAAARAAEQAGVPAGYRKKPDGGLEPIPGGPAGSTNDINNYSYAKSQGYQGTLDQFMLDQKRASAIKQLGEIPPGYRVVYDGQGNPVSMEKIPGGPLDTAATTARAQAVQGAQNVLDTIDRASEMVKANPVLTTGVGGTILQNLPGSAAKDVSALLTTIKANASLDRLQQMRAASPTGGALGNVSNYEDQILSAAIGNVEQSQSSDQLLYNLQHVRDVYKMIVDGVDPVSVGRDPDAAKILAAQRGGQTGSASPPVPSNRFGDAFGGTKAQTAAPQLDVGQSRTLGNGITIKRVQ